MSDHTLRLQLKTITAIAIEQKQSKDKVIAVTLPGAMSYKAELIIDQIPTIAQKAARDGLYTVQVMQITNQEITDIFDEMSNFKITGDAAMVYTKCHSAGLNPSINMIDGQFAICINW